MTISTGEILPDATLLRLGDGGPEQVQLSEKLKGRKVVLFGLPGAFTGPCTTAHVPSFIRTKGQFDDKGVDEIICIAVNDPFVMQAWGESTGATEAGLTFLADADASFTKAAGLDFSAPPAGLHSRSIRFCALVEDGVVSIMHKEDNPGVCEISAGEALLGAM